MTCPICRHALNPAFEKIILNKYQVTYYECTHCGFILTEKPYWLDEAYQEVITLLDIGYIKRNIELSKTIAQLIKRHFKTDGLFLDYAGGYGMFVRLMRDLGYNYYRDDLYAPNYFAKFFDINDLNQSTPYFELATAFEFLEHIQNPIEEFSGILKKTDTIVFSTLLQPTKSTIENWWYLSLETGQHISFYTIKSLQALAEQLNCHLYSNNSNLHIVSKKQLPDNILQKDADKSLIRRLCKKLCPKETFDNGDLTQQDYELIKHKLKK